MTQDEHDAKCWRALKRAIIETIPTLSSPAQNLSNDMQILMAHIEVFVEAVKP